MHSPHPVELVDSDLRIVSFAPDREGEPLIVDHSGSIYKLIASTEIDSRTAEAPLTLSETKLFSSVGDHQLAKGVHEFKIRAEMWHGGASAERFVAVPSNASISVRSGVGRKTMSQRVENYPTGTVFGKTLSIDSGGDAKRIETQLCFFDGLLWRYFTYVWNDDQSEARLVDVTGESVSVPRESMPLMSWTFLSRSQCTQCHQGPPKVRSSILGLIPEQFSIEPGEDHQLSQLEEFGIVDKSFRESTTKRLENPYDLDAALEDRARSYLHIHCGHCHSQHGGAIVPIDFLYDQPLSAMNILNQVPHRGEYGLESPLILKPGLPYESVMMHRLARSGSGRMPPVGGYQVDWNGFRVIRDWIYSQSSNNEPSDLSTKTVEALRVLDQANDDTGIREALSSTSGALALVDEISSNSSLDSTVLEIVTARAKEQRSLHILDLFRELTNDGENAISHVSNGSSNSLNQIHPNDVLGLEGDAERGKALLHSGKGQVCLSCHVDDGRGAPIGPSLDSASDRDDRAWMLSSIVDPSKWISPRYAVYQVETLDGESVSGFLLSHSISKVKMRTSDQAIREFPTKEISRIQVSDQSLMPPGLLTGWQPQEVADLLAALVPSKVDESGFTGADIELRWLAMGSITVLAGGLLVAHFRKSFPRRRRSSGSRKRRSSVHRERKSNRSPDSRRSRSQSPSPGHGRSRGARR
ncbi:MAG: putative heme-binding domain-containing protein [Verrucomicrobiales bacterium]